jgi:hypothetical protein
MKASSPSRLMPALLTRQSTEIGGHGQRFSAGGNDALHHAAGGVLAAMIVNRDAKSGLRQSLRHGRAQGSRGAGYQRRLFISRHRLAYLKGLKTMTVMPQREL